MFLNTSSNLPLMELEAIVNLLAVVVLVKLYRFLNARDNSTNLNLSMPNVIFLLGSNTGSNLI